MVKNNVILTFTGISWRFLLKYILYLPVFVLVYARGLYQFCF